MSWLLDVAEFTSSLRRLFREVIISFSCVMKSAKALVDSKDFKFSVVELVSTEIDKQLDSRFKRGERCRQNMES